MKKPKVIVVLPAYNAEATLIKTISDIPRGYVDEVILVDDASDDKTVDIARRLKNGEIIVNNDIPFSFFAHKQNRGYGGNQKTCYRLALEHDADIVVMLHPDYQYDPKLVKYFVDFIDGGYFDVMLGSRIRTRKEALAGGMPIYKYFFNRMLTLWENFVSGQNLSEWHTGMRAYSRKVFQSVDYNNNSDDFVFDTQMLFKIIERGFRIGEIPVPVRYFPEASSINFKRSIRYGLETVWESLRFLFRKI
ncbi:MAG: glycosyltransferase family 2 protein [Candidatus Vogelbacteria bacterium]|nr:glycosyltransferase family 2 protein [Candidatus Vogelbacteria bacterium]